MLKNMLSTLRLIAGSRARIVVLAAVSALTSVPTLAAAEFSVKQFASSLRNERGIVAVIGLPDGDPSFITKLVQQRELTVYFQSADPKETAAVQKAA